MINSNISRTLLAIMVSALFLAHAPARADDDSFAPGGTAMDHSDDKFHNMKIVVDLKARIPADVSFGIMTSKRIIAHPGTQLVVIIEGPAVALFAKKNYLDHQGVIDDWASLAQQGVKVEFCGNSVHGAGLTPKDMDGLSEENPAVVNPGAYPSLAHYEQMGYSMVVLSPQVAPAQ